MERLAGWLGTVGPAGVGGGRSPSLLKGRKVVMPIWPSVHSVTQFMSACSVLGTMLGSWRSGRQDHCLPGAYSQRVDMLLNRFAVQ